MSVQLGRADAGYEEARRATMWNARVPDRFPDLVIQARTDDDVVEAVRLAKREGVPIGVRSGGHSWAGNHVRDGGILLDVSRLDAVRIDAAAQRAVVGPGVAGHALLARLAKHGLFFPAGHCEGVRLGGYLLQGGFGWNGRALGMACESVLAIDYVDADGQIRHASETENADMLWAARGSGPGFFGVVLRFHLRLYPRPSFIGLAAASYSIDRLDQVFAWAHEVGPDVPASVELDLLVSRHATLVRGQGIQVAAFVFADSWGEAREATAFMKSRPRGARAAVPALPVPLPRLYRAAMGHYPDHHRYAVDNMWTRASWPELRPGVERIAATMPGAPSHMLWMNWTARPQRPDMAYSVEDDTYIALYAGWTDPADDDRGTAWARDRMDEMSSLSTGIQLADENLGRRPARFVTDDHLKRLDALRAEHDPDGRFHPWMGRPWT